MLSREECVDVTYDAMDIISDELADHVERVYEVAFKAGHAQAMREVKCSLNVLKANASNKNLTDGRFRVITRDLVRSIT